MGRRRITWFWLFAFVCKIGLCEGAPPSSNSVPNASDRAHDSAHQDWHWEGLLSFSGGFGFPPPNSDPPMEYRGILGLGGEVMGGPENGLRVGAELDTSYALPITTEEGELPSEQYQFFGNAKLGYAARMKDTVFIPSVGYGFGLLGAMEAGPQPTNDRILGEYVVLGFQVEHQRKLLVNADYAFSVNASRSDSEVNESEDRPNYFRVRFGVFYRIFDHWLAGFQFVQHGASRPPEPFSSGVFWESQAEGLGTLIFHF